MLREQPFVKPLTFTSSRNDGGRDAKKELQENSIEILPDKLYIAKVNMIINDSFLIKNAYVTDIIDLTGAKLNSAICNCYSNFCFHVCFKKNATRISVCADLRAAVNYLKKRVFKKDCGRILILDNSYTKLYALTVSYRYLKTYLFPEEIACKELKKMCIGHSITITNAVMDLEKSIRPLPVCPPVIL